MRVLDVQPHLGIGPLRLGMSSAEVRQAVAGHQVHKITGGEEDVVEPLGLLADYSAGKDAVAFVEARRVNGVRVMFAGRDVFATPADEMVAAVVRHAGLSPADYPPGRHEYLFPSLSLVLWRGVVGRAPGTRGWAFECVSVHVAGYYDADA